MAMEIESKKSFTCSQCNHTPITIELVTGYIYILSNSAMPGLLKIGFTERDVEIRRDELSNHTGIPAPFEIEACFAVNNPQETEKEIHKKLEIYRQSNDREFFRVSLVKAYESISSILGNPVFKLETTRLEFEKKLATLRVDALRADEEKRRQEYLLELNQIAQGE